MFKLSPNSFFCEYILGNNWEWKVYTSLRAGTWYPFKQECTHVINILDISTKLTPVHPPFSLPSCELKSISLTPLLAELGYLAASFILQLTHTASSVHHLKKNSIAKYPTLSINGAQEKVSCCLDGIEVSEHIGVRFVEISEIFATQDEFLLCNRTIWQSLEKRKSGSLNVAILNT